jgi:leucyl aminopeptidase (aminopeptidase T)
VRNDLVGKGKRVMGMHLLSDELALRTVPIDLDLLQKRVAKLTKLFPATEEARITSPEGTDITFSLRNRKFTLLYDGICNRGEYESVPAGVIGALPVPGTANGVIVIDGSLAGYGLVRAPIRITVKDGILTKIEGGAEAEWVEKSIKRALASGDRNANRFVEFDMGLNPNARVSFYGGKLREDELHLGGVNIGWGRDAHLGGTFEGVFHGDGIVMDVTISLDDVTVIKNGMPTQELS